MNGLEIRGEVLDLAEIALELLTLKFGLQNLKYSAFLGFKSISCSSRTEIPRLNDANG